MPTPKKFSLVADTVRAAQYAPGTRPTTTTTPDDTTTDDDTTTGFGIATAIGLPSKLGDTFVGDLPVVGDALADVPTDYAIIGGAVLAWWKWS